MNAARCPQCATAGTPDGGPGCSCRSALGAEGQAFQPLRVRPYMTPGETTADLPGTPADPPAPQVTRHPGPESAAGMRIAPPEPDWVDARVRPVARTEAETADLEVLTAPSGPAESGRRGRRNGERPQRGRLVPAMVAGAVVLVVTGAVLGVGRDGDDATEPDKVSATRDAIVPTTAGLATPTRSVSPSATPSPSASATATASPSAAVSRSAPVASAPPPTRASGTVTAPPPPVSSGALREGDRGPAVVELQRRLNQIMDPDLSVNGVYDSQVRHYVALYQSHFGISSDERGVYGADTRRHLESRTREP